MLEECLYTIKLTKNTGALEQKGQHMRGKKSLQALMHEEGTINT